MSIASKITLRETDMIRGVLIALVLAVAIPSAAQTVTNPTVAEFTPSPDHDNISRYDLDVVMDSTGVLIQVFNLGIPVIEEDGQVRAPINVMPVTFGIYHAVVRAIAVTPDGEIPSEDSLPSNLWSRIPGRPSNPILQ